MSWREGPRPVRMQRVALVAPTLRLRPALAMVAELGTVEVDVAPTREAAEHATPAHRVLQQLHAEAPAAARLARDAPDLAALAQARRIDLLTGEAQLEDVAAGAVVRGELSAVAGWASADSLVELSARLGDEGCAAYALPAPRGVDPPTLLHEGGQVRRSFAPLVDTYATVPYVDVDPTMLAGAAYVVMFGMMFGDVGHGVLLVLLGLLLRLGRPRWAAGAQRVWPFVVAAGVASAGFGFLYGEFFGPTGVVPVLWLRPLDDPVTLIQVAVGVGAVLLSGAYALGIVNRWREGGWALALVSASGLAGAAVFAGAGTLLLGLVAGVTWVSVTGGVLAASGLVLCYVGFLASSGGGAARVTQATVQLFDTTLRLGTNVVSFARLAAFGLTHAALGLLVWQLTVALWGHGGLVVVVAALAFLVGNAVAFALEALIAGVQALRLSYYELFSRVFTTEGRPFRPWHLPVEPWPVDVCAGGPQTADRARAGAAS